MKIEPGVTVTQQIQRAGIQACKHELYSQFAWVVHRVKHFSRGESSCMWSAGYWRCPWCPTEMTVEACTGYVLGPCPAVRNPEALQPTHGDDNEHYLVSVWKDLGPRASYKTFPWRSQRDQGMRYTSRRMVISRYRFGITSLQDVFKDAQQVVFE